MWCGQVYSWKQWKKPGKKKLTLNKAIKSEESGNDWVEIWLRLAEKEKPSTGFASTQRKVPVQEGCWEAEPPFDIVFLESSEDQGVKS